MSGTLLLILAIICYLLATFFTVSYVLNVRGEEQREANRHLLTKASIATFIGVIIHLFHAFEVGFAGGQLNLSLRSMMILISGILVAIYLVGSLLMPIRRLGILVYPLTIISLIFAMLWQETTHTLDNRSLALNVHILVSIVTYCLLTIATIQACLYVYQERQIKKRTQPAALLALPPLQTMEQLLFRLVGIGFALLTLTLLSGAIFSQQIFGHIFQFTHHIILAIMGWMVFAILLFKRFKHGLRGSQAFIWTICGFALIQLGYFGTKIITESLNLG